MIVLGISAFYHDSAAALLRNGDIVAAAQEERFSRRKHDAGFPAHAIDYCLAEGGVSMDQVDHVAFYDKPFLKFDRLLETYLAFAPRGFRSFRMAMPVWLREKLFLKDLLVKKLRRHGPGLRLGQPAPVLRAPLEPRRQRVLSVTVRSGRCAYDRRRRGVGDGVAGSWAWQCA